MDWSRFMCPVLLWTENLKLTYFTPSAATNVETNEGCAVKKVTNVFSKKILAKRALREIKLLQHFRGHPNVCHIPHRLEHLTLDQIADDFMQITCLYDMDIPRLENFNEVYLYEGMCTPLYSSPIT